MDENIPKSQSPAGRPSHERKRGESRSGKKRRIVPARIFSISILPSLVTLLNLFLGFRTLLFIIARNFDMAITFVTVCVVLDGFDGTIARLTRTESSFGVQLDSLNDGVTFGLTMAVMINYWGFKNHYSQLGTIIGFLFLTAGLIRLARFNVFKEAHLYPANIFIGLPIPVGALSICSWVLFFNTESPVKKLHIMLFALYAVIISMLMISNIHYRTVKNVNLKKHLPILLFLALFVGFVIIYQHYTLPVITTAYILSPIFFLFRNRRKKQKSSRALSIPETVTQPTKLKSGMER